MNKKRAIAICMVVALISTLFAGCGKKPAEKAAPSTETKKEEKKLKVGLSTDEGGLNDKSFNQSADTGIKKAQSEFGVDYKAVESKTKDDYEPNLGALVDENCDLIFGIGYQMHDAIDNEAKQHSDKKFAIVDEQVKEPNVESILFKENEGSFLVGVIAGKMTKTNKVGFIGGKNTALIEKFETGFAAGVKAVNPEAAKCLTASNENSLGKEVKYADSFADSNKGYELAKQLYADGCDVVFHAAGGVGLGLFKAASEIKKSGKAVWAIGVDMDQAESVTDKAGKPIYADVILTSMVKRVDTGTYNAVKDLVNNNFQGGKVVEFGLKEDGVGVAPSSTKNTPKAVLDLVNKYSDSIKAGTIKVPVQRKDISAFKAPEIK